LHYNPNRSGYIEQAQLTFKGIFSPAHFIRAEGAAQFQPGATASGKE
jgi:hypothetical protein